MEQLHCLIREVFVHRLPPRKGAGQYKASDWDPQYLWKGRLRVASVGKECFINLEDADTGALFAQCPYEPGGTAVESVSDSSRYFVLRVVDRDTKQSATIGIGFQERTDAFDFNVALQEFEKGLRFDEQVEKPSLASEPKVDYSLKEGQTITINLAGKTKKAPESTESPSFSPVSLPPPPGPSRSPSPSRTAELDAAFGAGPSNDPFAGAQGVAPTPSLGFDDAFGDSFEDAFVKSHPESSTWELDAEKSTDEAWATFS